VILGARNTVPAHRAIGRRKHAAARRARRAGETYERIHRSNLVGMGVLHCNSAMAKTPRPRLTGQEVFDVAD